MDINWAELNNLSQKYEGSFYLLNLEKFEENFKAFQHCFQDRYPKTKIAYSYKTNYLPQICKRAHSLGGYAEVVSRMEFDLAIRLGVPADRIIFNGPYKSAADLETALLRDATVHVDALYEVNHIKCLAVKHPDKEFKIGLRCNFELEEGGFSRFGFDVNHPSFVQAIQTLRSIPNCRIRGLHCHFSVSARTAKSYRTRTEKLISIAKKHFRSQSLDYIDIGGGFMSNMSPELKSQFPFEVPSWTQYAEAVSEALGNAYSGEDGPELILEPGVSITADIMHFVARVVDTKEIKTRRVALVDGSIFNVKPTRNQFNLPIEVISKDCLNSKPSAAKTHTDIVGYTCMESDFLYTGYPKSIEADDFVIFSNVGAYSLVLKPPFILPNYPVLAAGPKQSEWVEVKRKEGLGDVFSTFVFE